MKGLIFGGLVVGALGYLWMSQSTLGQQWLNDKAPSVAQVTEQAEQSFDRLVDHAHTATQLIEAHAEIKALKQQLEALSQIENTQLKSPSEASASEKLVVQLRKDSAVLESVVAQTGEGSQGQQAAKTSIAVLADGPLNNGLMSADERSEALFALMHRMELRAAGL